MKRLLALMVMLFCMCGNAWGLSTERSGLIYYPTNGTSLVAINTAAESRGFPVTIKLTHSGSGVSTPYVIPSGVTFSELVTLEFETGAVMDTTSIASGTVKILGGIVAGSRQHIFVGSNYEFTDTGGNITPNLFGFSTSATATANVTAFSNMADAVLTGQKVSIPSGDYAWNALELTKGITIEGAGVHLQDTVANTTKTTFVCASAVSPALTLRAGTTYGAYRLSNIYFDGNYETALDGLKVGVAGDIWLPGVTLDNIYIKRFSNNGLDLENCGEMTLETVWSQYNGNDGINIDGTITTLYFNNCKFDVNDRYGMYIKDLVSSDLGNTVIQSNVIGGLICDPDVQADINSNLMLNVHFEADDGTGEAYAQIIKGERWNIQLARTQSTNATKDFLFDIDYSTISLNMPAVTMDLTGDYNEVVATGTYNSVIGLVDSGTGNRILTQTSLGATATTPARDGTWIQGESLPLLGGATGHHAFTTATFVWDGVTGNQAFSNPDFPTDSGIVVPNDCYIVSASCKFDGGGALAGNALTVRFSTAENGDTNLTDDNSTVVMFSTSASTSRVSLDSSDLNTTLLDGRFRLSQGDTLCMRLNGDLGGNIFDVAVIVTLATKIGN